jgi:undecaprenyl-diphosphatase
MFHGLAELVGQYGYAIVVLFIIAESIGIPVPSEGVLIIAAALAAKGRLSIAGVIAAGTIGAILGGSAGFWIGRAGGQALLRRQGQRFGIVQRLEQAERFFARYGAPSVFFARYLSIVRTVIPMLAGASFMQFGRFSIYNGVGGLVWAFVFGGAGHYFGRTLESFPSGAGRAALAVVLLALLAFAFFRAWRRYRANRDAIATWAWRLWAETLPRSWRGLVARFPRGGYLSSHLTVGFLCSLVGLGVFAFVTESVARERSLTAFDLSVAEWLHAHATLTGTGICHWISVLGAPGMMTALAVAVAGVLAASRRWLDCIGWVAGLTGAALLHTALEFLIERPRPPYAADTLAGFSFPSSHAMGSLVAYGMLSYLILLHGRSRIVHFAVVTSAVLLIIAIGFSRLYLGAHYFSDVVGGYAAGLVWLSTCISGLEVTRRRQGTSGVGTVAATHEPTITREIAR